MAVYAVGDIQGCLSCLEDVLAQVAYDPQQDHLWAVGDLVNRGPQSLETLRFCRSLGSHFRTVLGNHDLHLLAIGRGQRKPSPKDRLNEILAAPDGHELLDWLRRQPLVFQELGYTVVHAGIPPQWSADQALTMAAEVEQVLRSDRIDAFLATMYGNQPDCWQPHLVGPERWRVITNYFTRMRFCDAEGRLELKTKTGPQHPPGGFAPWFDHRDVAAAGEKIIFGHWAALDGVSNQPEHLFPLDTGCVWGRRMRLMCLDDGRYYHTDCIGADLTGGR